MTPRAPREGFTLVELVIVVSILAILAGVMIPKLTGRMAKARDARRLADLRAVTAAIDAYYADTGEYPAPNENAEMGGWDVSHDGNFINDLVNKGYLREPAVDPINDDSHHYRYYRYEKGSYSCEGYTPFYVIGIKRFETEEFEEQHDGFFRCKGRDWSTEFAYVTGDGATFER